jgi:hypothetical protein
MTIPHIIHPQFIIPIILPKKNKTETGNPPIPDSNSENQPDDEPGPQETIHPHRGVMECHRTLKIY